MAKFKTFKLCQEIESLHPEFGNIYEATRSISGAMTWLQNNPNKTVLVYVGDEFNRITDKFNLLTLTLDPEDKDLTFGIYKDGKKIDLDEIKEWDVLSVAANDHNI